MKATYQSMSFEGDTLQMAPIAADRTCHAMSNVLQETPAPFRVVVDASTSWRSTSL